MRNIEFQDLVDALKNAQGAFDEVISSLRTATESRVAGARDFLDSSLERAETVKQQLFDAASSIHEHYSAVPTTEVPVVLASDAVANAMSALFFLREKVRNQAASHSLSSSVLERVTASRQSAQDALAAASERLMDIQSQVVDSIFDKDSLSACEANTRQATSRVVESLNEQLDNHGISLTYIKQNLYELYEALLTVVERVGQVDQVERTRDQAKVYLSTAVTRARVALRELQVLAERLGLQLPTRASINKLMSSTTSTTDEVDTTKPGVPTAPSATATTTPTHTSQTLESTDTASVGSVAQLFAMLSMAVARAAAALATLMHATQQYDLEQTRAKLTEALEEPRKHALDAMDKLLISVRRLSDDVSAHASTRAVDTVKSFADFAVQKVAAVDVRFDLSTRALKTIQGVDERYEVTKRVQDTASMLDAKYQWKEHLSCAADKAAATDKKVTGGRCTGLTRWAMASAWTVGSYLYSHFMRSRAAQLQAKHGEDADESVPASVESSDMEGETEADTHRSR